MYILLIIVWLGVGIVTSVTVGINDYRKGKELKPDYYFLLILMGPAYHISGAIEWYFRERKQ